MKKVLGIIGIVIVIVALGLVSYYYFVFNKVDPTTGKKESFREFLPFGKDTGSGSSATTSEGNDTGEQTGTSESGPAVPVALPALQQITAEPVAGEMILEEPYATSSIVRYVERATGNIYDFSIATGTLSRTTNTTVPMIREALWNQNGTSLIMRFLDQGGDFIQSYYGTFNASVSATEGNRELTGDYLPSSIASVTSLGTSGKIFSIIAGQNGASGYVSAMNGSGRTLVFQSPIREWNTQGVDANTVALTTKPASYVQGFTYFYNIATASLTKVIGNVTGLTTLTSHDGSYVLFGEDDGGYKLRILNVKNKSVRKVDLTTVPEKCAWSPDDILIFCAVPNKVLDSDFLDLWHQGIVSTADNLWEINPVDGTTLKIEGMEDKNIDAIDLVSDSSRSYLTFINKKDLSLWIFRMSY
jgi:hypothetical protein